MEAIHLPLVQFFRLRLSDEIREKLMHGAALIAIERATEDRFALWGELLPEAQSDFSDGSRAEDPALFRQ